MKKIAMIIMIGLSTLVIGCIPSLHPLYTDQDVIFDPLLVGEWENDGGKQTWTFAKSGDNAYSVIFVGRDEKKGEFLVHLVKVGDHQFLDFFPQKPDLPQNDFYKGHLMPVHTFMRVDRQGDSLELSFLKPDWIRDYLRAHPEAIKHEEVDNSILLTAQPKQLQAFVLENGDSPEAWDSEKLQRRPMAKDAEKAAE